MDKVEVSTITPLPRSLFHTRNRSHVAVGDMATHNGQQNEQTTRDDDLARQQTCHIVRTVMTTSVVTVHIDPGE
jgi:hypothetical protein